MTVTISVVAVVAVALGALIAWIVASGRARREYEASLSGMKRELEAQIAQREVSLQTLRDDEYRQREELAQLKEQVSHLADLKGELRDLREQKDSLRDQSVAEQQNLTKELAETRSALIAERAHSAEILAARGELSNQFEVLANKILDAKTKTFTEQNHANLGQILDPLKLQLEQFRTRVDAVYVQESKDRSALSSQVNQLMVLNQQLSEDADNLTKALKGSSKTQGNWGELILERVLEAGGLRKGEEYSVQESLTREDGSRGQPDVIVNLPERRHLVIDAKVSLTAYEEYASGEDETARDNALSRHADSVRSHIKGLSGKSYQSLYGLETLDFVIMFIPIEPAFMLAISRDPKLWQEAWQKNVLLVSPSTLLFVVRTVSHLWRQEKQNRSVQEIVGRGKMLYDKLTGFVSELEVVGDKLNQAKDSYSRAFEKLHTGKGNVIRQAEMLKELGVKPNKNLPAALVELASEQPLFDEEKEVRVELDSSEPQLFFAVASETQK
jgi:DNA recombination protein RmuC